MRYEYGTGCNTLDAIKAGPPLVETGPLAEVAGVCVRTIRNMCERGELRAVKVGSQWRVNRDQALTYFGLSDDGGKVSVDEH